MSALPVNVKAAADRGAFKKCTHGATGEPAVSDWRMCVACMDEVQLSLTIARAYLHELAHARFNDNGDCVAPVSEPVQGRSFQQIAQTALGIIS